MAGPGKLLENFLKSFLEIIFGVGKYFGKKFCADSMNYFC